MDPDKQEEEEIDDDDDDSTGTGLPHRQGGLPRQEQYLPRHQRAGKGAPEAPGKGEGNILGNDPYHGPG